MITKWYAYVRMKQVQCAHREGDCVKITTVYRLYQRIFNQCASHNFALVAYRL